MLELKKIHKDYQAGSGTVHALRGIDLQFRESEFVSILGPSGCGKTTLLNIIGGLDKYTSGDLSINGRSTKGFKDRDWDTYRNHSIGFVFQSYNLIPHQTVLQNVEIALTLSGVSKQERRKRAIRALEDVGLGDQLRKRPAQMSGGQMQRVAIARALVNDPDIILADEPTGALDSETSVQIMQILKKVAQKRLVIMVTHNPELAEEYSTRIIRMLDGKLLSDSDPLAKEEIAQYQQRDAQKLKEGKKEKKPSMGWLTAFGLSLKNLIAKRGRTILTSFAGSIGIIGIALIYAVSNGMTMYINTVQEDALSAYPLTIEATTVELGTLMNTFMNSAESAHEHELDAVYSKSMAYNLINALNEMESTENDLRAFKVYLEEARENPDHPLHDAISGLLYSYDLNLLVYTKNVDDEIVESDAEKLLQELMSKHMGMDMTAMMSMGESGGGMMSMMSKTMPTFQVWQEMLPGDNGRLVSDLLDKQYDVVYGSWPTEYNEIVLVLDENHEVDDMTLYALGLKSAEEMDRLTAAAISGEHIEAETSSWTYEELLAREYRVILPGDCYTLDENTGLYTDMRETDAGLRYLYDNGLTLKISGIIRPSEEAVSGMMKGSIGYTSQLTEHLIASGKSSAAVQAQLADPYNDIITGLPFRGNTGEMTNEQKQAEFMAYIEKLDQAALAEVYVKIMSIPSQETLETLIAQQLAQVDEATMRQSLVQILTTQMGMAEADIAAYVEGMSGQDVMELYVQMISEGIAMQYAAQVQEQMLLLTDEQKAYALSEMIGVMTPEQFGLYYDQVLEFAETTWEDNLVLLGCLDMDDPAAINIFTATFAQKDAIVEAIDDYNSEVDETKKITYTDYVGILMSSVTTIIDAITYVLIAFVAISLIVSSIMIGVITLISVQERTKEIGILRAIGASKRNVSSMFNAETIMIGAASGLLGVGVTWLLCIPINAIIHYLTGIPNLSAYLPISTALILVFISIFLSVFAGFIPSRSAAKKDPVVALRTE